MKRLLFFLIAILIYAVVHEGTHALVGALYGETEAFYVRPYGLEVTFRTPVPEHSGFQWAVISGAPNLLTVLLAHLLLWAVVPRVVAGGNWLRAVVYYVVVVFLLADPFNLSLGPLLYGGDAIGVAVGLGVSRYVVQAVSLVVLLVNRELLAQRLLPLYGIETQNPLFRAWIKLPSKGAA